MVQGHVGKRLPLTAVFLAVLVLAACQRTATPGRGGAPGSPAAPSSTASSATSTTTATPQPGSAAANPAPPSRTTAGAGSAVVAPAAFAGAAIGGAPRGGRAPTDAKPGAAPGSPAATGTGLALASAGSLMAMGRGRAGMLPEDFRIGPLASGRSGVPDKDAAYAVAVSFLSRLVAGTVDRQEIAPESQESLADTLSYGLQKGYAPSSFRIGEPKEGTDGELAVNVRLFDANSSSEGEIYLSRAADRWLVADVQVNLADLATPSPTPKEKFFPSPYRWLLEN